MFVIEASKNNKRWISGIFSRLHDAEAYLKEIPENLIRYQKLYEIPQKEYPIYITETNGFTFLSRDELKQKLDSIVQSGDDDMVYLNFYIINEEYRPKKAGTDYMGILRHEHVDNFFLRTIKDTYIL